MRIYYECMMNIIFYVNGHEGNLTNDIIITVGVDGSALKYGIHIFAYVFIKTGSLDGQTNKQIQ